MSSNLKVNSLVPATGTEIGIGTTGGSIDFRCPATFGGNVTIGGTLTYDEVINIDSIGIITARTGINVSSGTATFAGAIDANGDLDVDGHTNLDNVSIAGVSTFSSNATFSSNVLVSGKIRIENTSYAAQAAGNELIVGTTSGDNGITIASGNSGTGNIYFGDGDSNGIGYMRYDHNSNFLKFNVNGSERLRIKSNGAIVKGNSGTQVSVGNGANTQIIGSSGADASLALIRQAAGGGEFYFAAGTSGTNISSGNGLGFIKFMGYHTDGYDEYARIEAYADGTTGNGDAPGRIVFKTTADGANSGTERLRINSDGAVHIQDGSATAARFSIGNSGDLKIFHTNPTTFIQDSSTALVINAARLDINNAADSEQMARFTQDGAVELYHNNIKQCETSANGLAFPSGKGIDFSATSAGVGTMTSELFDDYEEGIFTPTMKFGGGNTGMSLTSMAGIYTKIGRVVYVTVRYYMAGKGSSTGQLTLEGLPFAVGDVLGTTAVQGGWDLGWSSGMASGIHEIKAYPWEATSYLKFAKRTNSNSSPEALTHSDIVSAFDGRISFFYTT